MWALVARAAAALVVSAPGVGLSRPYTVEDLIALETVAGAAIDPSGRWAVIQTYAPLSAAEVSGDDGWPQPELGRLYRTSLRGDGPALPIESIGGGGLLAGPFSPDGRRMVVFQAHAGRWRAGVLSLATGRADWLSIAPEAAVYGRTVQWVGSDRLLAIGLRAGGLPRRLGLSWRVRLALGSSAAAPRGAEVGAQLMGSGAFQSWGRPPPAHDLVSVDLRTHATTVLAEGDMLDMEASPDGDHVAILEERRQAPPSPEATIRVGTPSRRRSVRIIDLRNGRVDDPCPVCDLTTQLLSWSPSGRFLLVHALDAPDGPGFKRVVVADGRIEGLSPRGLTPRLSATTEGIPYAHGVWAGERALGLLQRADAPDDRADWYPLDGEPDNLTAALAAPPDRAQRSMGASAVLTDGLNVWRLAADSPAVPVPNAKLPAPRFGAGVRFAANPPDPASVVPAAGPSTAVDGSAPFTSLLADDGLHQISYATDARGVGSVSVRGAEGIRTVMRLNRRLADVDTSHTLALAYRDEGGRPQKAWLRLPARVPAPLVVVPYPGATFGSPPTAGRPDAPDFATLIPVLLGAGYAVLQPSLPVVRMDNHPSRGFVDNVLAATDAAIATGKIDPGRLAIFGHSFGGYAALTVAEQSNRFGAVIASAAPTNLAAVWGTINPLFDEAPTFDGVIHAQIGWADAGQGHLWAPPWRAAARYDTESPFFGVDKITAPVLLITGADDFIPPTQSQSLFAALYRQGKSAGLLGFRNEGHVIEQPANVRITASTVLAFLNEALESPRSRTDGKDQTVQKPQDAQR